MTTARALPKFRGYTVDARLREFRRVRIPRSKPGEREVHAQITFIPFDSPAGRVLIQRMIDTGHASHLTI